MPLHESAEQKRNGLNHGFGCLSVLQVDSAENEGRLIVLKMKVIQDL